MQPQTTYSSSVNNLDTTNGQISGSGSNYDDDTNIKRVNLNTSLLGNEYSLSKSENSNYSNSNNASNRNSTSNNGNDDKTNRQNEINYDINQFNNDFSDLVRANTKLMFEQFDKDNDGKITRNELNFVMCNLFPDETITSQDIDEMLHAADLDNNGFIDFEGIISTFLPSLLEIS